MRTTTLTLAATVALVLTGAASAQDRNVDKIYLTDGSVLKDVGVVSEGLQEVEYRSGRNKSTVPSERVLRIEFGQKPKTVDQADTSAGQEDYLDAIAGMQNYVAAVEEKPDKRFPWAAAYARYRIVDFHGVMGDLQALGAAADEVIAKHPDTRYAPLAFLAKAQAFLDAGDVAKAKAAADSFGRFITDKGLAGRWPVEQRLWAALTSGETGKKLEDTLIAVSTDAAEYPSVRNRSEVAIAEALFAGKKYAEAEKIFSSIVKDAKADSRTLAAAWTGLGDCLYYGRFPAAPAEEKPELLKSALKAYLRPVVVYPDESIYVAKAAFHAGRCYQELGGDAEATDRAKRLYAFVITNFKGSRWEREARQFYGR
jgi:tetratricopeptide (TPR) repeat protein